MLVAIVSVNDSSPLLCLFNVYSNSFITQATDFYGRNDMDMVRSSILFYYTRMFTNRNLVATVRLLLLFWVFLNRVHPSIKGEMVASHMKNLNHILRLGP